MTIKISLKFVSRGPINNILPIIGSDNGLPPDQRQAIIWTNIWILLIGPEGANFSETLSKFIHFHSRKCISKCRLENGGHIVSALMYLIHI